MWIWGLIDNSFSPRTPFI